MPQPEAPGETSVPSPERAHGARTTMAALQHAPDVFETFFESARIGLALADLSGRLVRVNETYAALLGAGAEDLVGVQLSTVVPESAFPGPGLEALLTGHEPSVQGEASHVRPDGGVVWLLHGLATVSDAGGVPRWLAVSAQDITERRRVELELRALSEVLAEQAVRDPLTGLANRALLEERLRASLARDARTGGTTAVLFLDLDGFKEVNDAYGHAVGDEVLRAVADRLTAVVRPSDTVARLGGDEFVVLIESATDEAVEALVPRVHDAVGRSSQVRGSSLTVGVSVGVATSQGGDQDPAGLIAAADERMYVAKRGR